METKLLLDLALILFAAKFLGLATRRLHLPQVVGALLTGIILGPALLGAIETNQVIEVVAQIGVLLILFEGGLETNLDKLRKSFKSLLVISLCGVTMSLIGGYTLARIFGHTNMESIFIGVILVSSSIGIAVEVLHEMGKLNSKTGTTIMGALVVEDIFAVIIFSTVISMGSGDVSLANIGISLMMKLVFFILTIIFGFLTFKLFEFLIIKQGMRKRLSIFGLAFCFLMAYAAERFGIADIIGAYVAGLILCNSKAEKYIEARTDVLSFMFFSPIFFVSVGLKMSFDGLTGDTVLFAVLFMLMAVFTKFVGCGFGASIFKYSKRESAQVGAGMVARCEFPVVAAVIGKDMGLIDDKMFTSVIIMVITTTLIAPILLKIAFKSKSSQEIELQEVK